MFVPHVERALRHRAGQRDAGDRGRERGERGREVVRLARVLLA